MSKSVERRLEHMNKVAKERAKDKLISTDTIECPACHVKQQAEVWHYAVNFWPSYGHVCEACGYYIMESEWNEVKDDQ